MTAPVPANDVSGRDCAKSSSGGESHYATRSEFGGKPKTLCPNGTIYGSIVWSVGVASCKNCQRLAKREARR